jgi:hypothetical protein
MGSCEAPPSGYRHHSPTSSRLRYWICRNEGPGFDIVTIYAEDPVGPVRSENSKVLTFPTVSGSNGGCASSHDTDPLAGPSMGRSQKMEYAIGRSFCSVPSWLGLMRLVCAPVLRGIDPLVFSQIDRQSPKAFTVQAAR